MMLLRKRPQECNAAIQECPTYTAETSDLLSSSHESNVNDARNLHSYMFMEIGYCSADVQVVKPSDSDSEYSDSDYSDNDSGTIVSRNSNSSLWALVLQTSKE